MPYCTNVGFIPNDGPTANVLIHIIIYSTLYKKNVFVFISVALEFTYFFDIRPIVKLLKRCLIIS